MSLPKIDVPIFTTTLPSNKSQVKYKQYSVKEEKVLLIAEQSKDANGIVEAIKQVVSNCLLVDLDIDKMPIFDIEWLFLQLRMKSVGEIVEFRIQDFEDQKIYDLEMNLEDVKIEIDEDKSLIPLGKNLHVKLRYPSMSEMDQMLNFDKSNPDHTIKFIASLIECIYDEDSVHTAEIEELIPYVESFPKATMLKIEEFFESIPRVEHSIEYVNSLGNKRTFKLKGLQDFFQ